MSECPGRHDVSPVAPETVELPRHRYRISPFGTVPPNGTDQYGVPLLDAPHNANPVQRPDEGRETKSRESLIATSHAPRDQAPRRQVLIVGDGVAGMSLALFLQEAGNEPLLVYTQADHPVSSVATIASSGLTLLDRVGIGSAVREAGHRLDTLTFHSPETSQTHSMDDGGDAPILITTSRLRDLLRARIEPGTTPVSMGVESLNPREDSVEVTFDSGVREQFDAVVGTDGPLSAVRVDDTDSPSSWSTWTQWEIILHDIPRQDPPIVERWNPPIVSQLFTSAADDLGSVLRITDTTPDTESVTIEPIIDELVGDLTTDSIAVTAGDWARHQISQAPWNAGRWTGDSVAYCGPSALPMAPATGVETMLGIEDAWVLADELSTATNTTADALLKYRQRRRNRVETVARRAAAARTHTPCPSTDGTVLEPTSDGRAVALGPLCDGSLGELHRAIPNRL